MGYILKYSDISNNWNTVKSIFKMNRIQEIACCWKMWNSRNQYCKYETHKVKVLLYTNTDYSASLIESYTIGNIS